MSDLASLPLRSLCSARPSGSEPAALPVARSHRHRLRASETRSPDPAREPRPWRVLSPAVPGHLLRPVTLHRESPEHGVAHFRRRRPWRIRLSAGRRVEHRQFGARQLVQGQLARFVLMPAARHRIRRVHAEVAGNADRPRVDLVPAASDRRRAPAIGVDVRTVRPTGRRTAAAASSPVTGSGAGSFEFSPWAEAAAGGASCAGARPRVSPPGRPVRGGRPGNCPPGRGRCRCPAASSVTKRSWPLPRVQGEKDAWAAVAGRCPSRRGARSRRPTRPARAASRLRRVALRRSGSECGSVFAEGRPWVAR